MASPLSSRARTSLAQRAIDRAIDGGKHQVIIDEEGRTRILPLGSSLAQAEDAVLDAEIQELLDAGHGHGRP